jgi:hypothetical protein
MGKNENPNVWKTGIKELILVFSILIIGSMLTIFLAVLLPKIPLEGAVLLAGIILFVVFGAIALTVYIIKEIKNKN